MNSPADNQPPCVGASAAPLSASKLRPPLRSALKLKTEKPAVTEAPTFSATSSKRGRPPSAVSRSVNVLDLSGKEKSAKPPRRLSIPNKSAVKSRPSPAETVSPISQNRAKRSNTQRRDTPISDVSKSMSRKKFCVLNSASYWLMQIKLSEAASKHSISLGFFKLALESGCEPLDRMQEELKSYIRRHNLVEELAESVKELLSIYNIIGELDKLSISDTVSNSSKDNGQKSDKGTISLPGNGTLKPKSLNLSDVAVAASARKKETIEKNQSATKNTESVRKSIARFPVKDSGYKSKKPHMACKEHKGDEQNKTLSAKQQGNSTLPLPPEDASNENKENVDGHLVEEANTA